MRLPILLSTSLLILTITAAYSQDVAIGQWKVHLPYNQGTSVVQVNDLIYCGTQSGLFYYNTTDNSINRLSKIDGFSDLAINAINYDKDYNILIIAYSNGNIDLVKDNKITNLPEIKDKMIPGTKEIHKIIFNNNYAYLCCSFGIVVYDMQNNEFKESYINFGPDGESPEVFDLAFQDSSIFAATDLGILEANKYSFNLLDYKSWTLHDDAKNIPAKSSNAIVSFNDSIYANVEDSLYIYNGNTWRGYISGESWEILSMNSMYNKLLITKANGIEIIDSTNNREEISTDWYMPDPQECIMNEEGVIWIADFIQGLCSNESGTRRIYRPDGPASNEAYYISISGNDVWVASGGVDNIWGNIWNNDGLFSYIDDDWKPYNRSNKTPGLDTINYTDLVTVAVSPKNGNIFTGSMYGGLIELDKDKGVLNHYTGDDNKSTLDWQFNLFEKDSTKKACRIFSLAFDDNNNLWISNIGATSPLSVLRSNDTWESFDFGNISDGGYMFADIIIDDNDQKWILLGSGEEGILVFDDNNTIADKTDDQFTIVSKGEGNGNLPSNGVHSIAKDLNGEIWVGTDEGITVFYAPYLVFSGDNFDAQQIFVEQDGYTAYLLETETVTAIAVDGANRKWLGTYNGIWLVSEDGTEVIQQFNTDNSPLLSNNITSIAINNSTGEVFIGTDQGIISYRSTATEGQTTHQNVLVYPNPVRENFTGDIAIKGLVENANVKITDISGNMIYETTALGGQAIWNGKNYNGDRAQTGVYLIFSSNDDGSETYVAKLLFIN
ncbi:MAG: hypothetical protein COC01_03060 [Bacteroidetes bacterium]|nr:MAG: hypothetical protein COC01_03060 [Bacteroidota bacterium]